MSATEDQFVSRGGVKLAAGLAAFQIDVAGLDCLDLGCHIGGFVDCLLQRGAARVTAVDPGYGVLHTRLRTDPRVVVCERTNALKYVSPALVDLVTIDAGWTPQRLILPAARRCVKPDGRVISLVKPQYECPAEWRPGGVVIAERLSAVLDLVRSDLRALRWAVIGEIMSPIAGHGGNREFLWHLRPE